MRKLTEAQHESVEAIREHLPMFPESIGLEYIGELLSIIDSLVDRGVFEEG